MQGLVLKGVGGFYTVLAQGREYTCKARGKFRQDDISPAAGDRVEFDTQQCRMVSILPRKNLLNRPVVANVDQLVVVISATKPKPDLLLVDKLLLQAALAQGVTPVIVLNKCDAVSDDAAGDEVLSEVISDYAAFCPVQVSALTLEGLGELRARLKGKISCFAGQSAVGKSSLLNALIPGLGLEVGGLAKKTDRGRHTTRNVELWPYEGGALIDTPGFSMLDIGDILPEKLARYYPEFAPFLGECYFLGCLHEREPDCAVKREVGKRISCGRYERYVKLLNVLKEKRRTRYD